MRKFDPREVFDTLKLSEALFYSLNEVTKKCHGFTAQKFAIAIHLTPSELTRMKLFFLAPQGRYSSVCLRELRETLILLLGFFSDLKLYQRNDGSIRAVFPIDKLPSLRSHSCLIQNNLLIPARLGRPRKSKTYAKDYDDNVLRRKRKAQNAKREDDQVAEQQR